MGTRVGRHAGLRVGLPCHGAAAHRRGLTGRRVTLDLDGGTLEIDWRDDGVWMTGPVAEVFAAELSPAFLAAL